VGYNYLHPFRPRLLAELKTYNRAKFAADLGAGITVGVVALPLALAFGIASGVKPEQGLITAIVAGFLISALGGSQVQIGGPAGAFIVIIFGIIERYGFTNLLLSTVMAGLLMFLLGLFKLGALIRYIPVSIVIGFTNGIAVLIGLSQMRDLLGLDVAKMPGDFVGQMGTLVAQAHSFNPWALALGSACVVGLTVWPRLFSQQRALPAAVFEARPVRMASRLPAPIVALTTLTMLAWALELPVETIGSRFGELASGLPTLNLPPFSWETARHLFIPTITIALLGAIESLLCARVADNLAGGAPSFQRHDPNQELMAQGVANVITPLLGGIPATGTIARTVTNVRAGAVSPVAGMVHAATLLLILLLAAPLAGHVPLAVLAGILLFMAWNMFEGHQFTALRNHSVPYRTVVLGTFFLTIVFDLTVAVEVGLVLACGFFIWRMGTLFSAKPLSPEACPPGLSADTHAVALYGPLFFGAVGKIEALADAVPPGTRTLVLDMQQLVSIDNSGLDALEQLHSALRRRGVAMVLARVNEQPLAVLVRAGFAQPVGAVRVVDNLAALVSGVVDPSSGGNRTPISPSQADAEVAAASPLPTPEPAPPTTSP
jgi:sulfate permease, SulP family